MTRSSHLGIRHTVWIKGASRRSVVHCANEAVDERLEERLESGNVCGDDGDVLFEDGG